MTDNGRAADGRKTGKLDTVTQNLIRKEQSAKKDEYVEVLTKSSLLYSFQIMNDYLERGFRTETGM